MGYIEPCTNWLKKMLGVEDYIALEETSECRHEYVAGTLHAMSGGTREHNRIAGNIYVRCWHLVQGKGCRVYQEGMKLRPSETVFYYPDVMVVCNPPPSDRRFETAPCVVVEVLSRSAKNVDLHEKLIAYQHLPSVELCLIVDSERLAVKRYCRTAPGV